MSPTHPSGSVASAPESRRWATLRCETLENAARVRVPGAFTFACEAHLGDAPPPVFLLHGNRKRHVFAVGHAQRNPVAARARRGALVLAIVVDRGLAALSDRVLRGEGVRVLVARDLSAANRSDVGVDSVCSVSARAQNRGRKHDRRVPHGSKKLARRVELQPRSRFQLERRPRLWLFSESGCAARCSRTTSSAAAAACAPRSTASTWMERSSAAAAA